MVAFTRLLLRLLLLFFLLFFFLFFSLRPTFTVPQPLDIDCLQASDVTFFLEIGLCVRALTSTTATPQSVLSAASALALLCGSGAQPLKDAKDIVVELCTVLQHTLVAYGTSGACVCTCVCVCVCSPMSSSFVLSVFMRKGLQHRLTQVHSCLLFFCFPFLLPSPPAPPRPCGY